jgi:RecA-family ATPase
VTADDVPPPELIDECADGSCVEDDITAAEEQRLVDEMHAARVEMHAVQVDAPAPNGERALIDDIVEGRYAGYPADVQDGLRRVANNAMLSEEKRRQWVDVIVDNDGPRCPECGVDVLDRGHKHDCPRRVRERDGERLFRRWTMRELLAEPDDFRWDAKGLIVAETFGMLAGEWKTLKTHIAQVIDTALASGVSVFGRFDVPEPCPVIAYVGEGGRKPYRRRLERIAATMGVNLADIPLFPSFDVAPIDSPRFRNTLARDLAEIRPGHVDIDPYYAFQGASDARNVHDEGAALAALSAPITDAGASMKLVNHYNQTGTGRGLHRITMAGGGEWSDSWWLVSHRETPDVKNGRFRLLLEVGSRQWGGSTWDLDLNVGRFDIDAGDFTGDITWDIAAHFDTPAEADTEDAVIQILLDGEWQHTKTQLVGLVGGNVAEARAAVNRLERQGRIRHALVGQPEGEGGHRRMVRRDRYAMTSEPEPDEEQPA